MHSDYDSHYVRIRHNGEPVTSKEEPFYEEFVIKESDRIIPLYAVALRRSYRCAIWRDINIKNDSNTTFLTEFRLNTPFNIYALTESREALETLKVKHSANDIGYGIITSGADEGEQFVRKCRQLYPNMPVVVFCKRKDYHQQWAQTLAGPEVFVTANAAEVSKFINNAIKEPQPRVFS